MSSFVNGDGKEKEERTCLYSPESVIGLHTVEMKGIGKFISFTQARKQSFEC